MAENDNNHPREDPPYNQTRGIGWRPIKSFDPARRLGSYLFADGSNIILGHWYEGESEPRMAYTGQEFPTFPTHWMPLPEPPQ